MRYRWLCLLCAAVPRLALSSAPDAASGAAPLLGYSAAGAAAQEQWEKKFRAGISPDNIRENMRRLSARPHRVGGAARTPLVQESDLFPRRLHGLWGEADRRGARIHGREEMA